MIPVRLTLDPAFRVGPVRRRTFGSFVEHLGRCVYTGIHDPGAPDGRRRRLPQGRARADPRARRHAPCATPAATSSPATAGRTASARATSARPASTSRGTRPTPTRSASTSSCAGRKLAGVEPMMAVNLGTRGVQEAARPARVLQRPRRHAPVRPAPRERRGGAVRHPACGAWATRWTARGRSATRRPTSTAGSPPRPRGRCAWSTRTSSSSRAARPASPMPDVRRVGADRAHRGLRPGRLHLRPRVLLGGGRRPRLVPGLRRRHGPLRRRPSRATADAVRAHKKLRQADPHLVRRVERLVPAPRRVRAADGHDWPVAPRAARGQVQRRRRRRRRQPADLAAAAHRPRALRVARAAGQRDRADHDRAGRPVLEADDLPPVRAGLPATRPATCCRSPSRRRPTRRRSTATPRWSTPSPPATPRRATSPCSRSTAR